MIKPLKIILFKRYSSSLHGHQTRSVAPFIRNSSNFSIEELDNEMLLLLWATSWPKKQRVLVKQSLCKRFLYCILLEKKKTLVLTVAHNVPSPRYSTSCRRQASSLIYVFIIYLLSSNLLFSLRPLSSFTLIMCCTQVFGRLSNWCSSRSQKLWRKLVCLQQIPSLEVVC